MKYFAILKDSLREALDSKVLFVLLAFSTLTILFVASISYKPLSAEITMKQFFPTADELPLAAILDSHKPEKQQGRRPGKMFEAQGQFRLVKVEVVRGEPDSPDSDYVLTIAPAFWRGDDVEDKEKQRKDSLQSLREIFHDAEEFGYLRVGAVELAQEGTKAGEAPQYRVTLESTPGLVHIWYTEPMILGIVPIGKVVMGLVGYRTGPLGFQLFVFARLVLYFGSWVAVLTGIIVTSFFVPNMLRKGTVDLLLAKPLHRWILLLYKYIGGLTFIFLNAAYAIGGIWLAIGLRSGLWPNGMLLLILTTTFFFAILYAISTLVAVWTRSTVTAIMVTIVAWIMFFAIGFANRIFQDQHIKAENAQVRGQPLPEDEQWGDSTAARVIGVMHATTPRTSDLEQINEIIVFTDFMTGNLSDIPKFDTSKRNWWESLAVAGAWIAVCLGFACGWFTFKDY